MHEERFWIASFAINESIVDFPECAGPSTTILHWSKLSFETELCASCLISSQNRRKLGDIVNPLDCWTSDSIKRPDEIVLQKLLISLEFCTSCRWDGVKNEKSEHIDEQNVSPTVLFDDCSFSIYIWKKKN